MLKKASNEDKKIIRNIAKTHNITGCAQPLHAVHVGKQGRFLSQNTVDSAIRDFTKNGFLIEPIYGNLVDVLMVWRKA